MDSGGIGDSYDNCPGFANPDQLDTDGDSIGNLCDLDDDNDTWLDETEITCGSDPINIDVFQEITIMMVKLTALIEMMITMDGWMIKS